MEDMEDILFRLWKENKISYFIHRSISKIYFYSFFSIGLYRRYGRYGRYPILSIFSMEDMEDMEDIFLYFSP